ncbi:hypothetical protein [Planktothrix sp. FACHB-1365]|uniref:hypothetical protein n=1 Tax=Planktothrix sp. FACHB-1365 TaxID=2692855 RepID=UPI0016858F49|nr:hypothetical protein [Planktothrix sp. FACHB-1365]MBD2484785.1 hypothetical protein [Planktothrix sp. FACHB-1365]
MVFNRDLLRNPVSGAIAKTQETGFLIQLMASNPDIFRNPVSGITNSIAVFASVHPKLL